MSAAKKKKKGFFLDPLTSKYNKLRSCSSALPQQNATMSRWQQKDNDDSGDKFHQLDREPILNYRV